MNSDPGCTPAVLTTEKHPVYVQPLFRMFVIVCIVCGEQGREEVTVLTPPLGKRGGGSERVSLTCLLER